MKKTKLLKFFYAGKNQFSLRCADQNIFRLLKLSFVKKKVLDIGYGDGENLFEFDRRGARTYGISLSDKTKYLKKYLSNFKIANFVHCDLNEKKLTECFPKKNYKFSKKLKAIRQEDRQTERDESRNFLYEKFDVIISTDTIYYIDDLNEFFKEVYKILKKGGFFLFQYIESQYKLNFNNENLKNLHLVGNLKNYTKYIKYSNNKNPIIFLKNKIIKKYISDSKLTYLNSAFNYSFYSDKKKNNFTHKNIFVLLKKTY